MNSNTFFFLSLNGTTRRPRHLLGHTRIVTLIVRNVNLVGEIRMVCNMSEWRFFLRHMVAGLAQGMNPKMTRSHNKYLFYSYETLSLQWLDFFFFFFCLKRVRTDKGIDGEGLWWVFILTWCHILVLNYFISMKVTHSTPKRKKVREINK